MIFTAIDYLMAAMALYVLLPPMDLGFVPFLAVFMAAIIAGVVSHVPGGIGVFETVILAALPASVPLEHAAAGLLLYRIIYSLVPFSVALVLLAVNEVRQARASGLSTTLQTLSPVFKALSATVPMAASVMVFGAGAYILVAPLIPSSSALARDFDHVLPLMVVEGGALVSSVVGAALVVIAHALLRRIEGAWWLTLVLLACGVVASLAHGIDYQPTIVLGLVFLILLPMCAEFRRSTRLTRDVLSLRWFLLLASLGIAVLALLFFAHKATPFEHEMWWPFAADQSAPRALRASFVGLASLAMIVLFSALQPGSFSHDPATPDMLEQARRIIAAQGNPDANIALTGDKSLLFSDSGNAVLMYRIQGRTWVALHEPFGVSKELLGLAWEFYDAAYRANARPAFYSVNASSVPIWLELGLTLHKMGEAAIVPLETFGLESRERKKLRTAHNRAVRDGLSFEIIPAPVPMEMMEALRAISDDWLRSKSSGEKGFSVGTFDADRLARAPIAPVSNGGQVVAFASLWLTDKKERATIDLMRCDMCLTPLRV